LRKGPPFRHNILHGEMFQRWLFLFGIERYLLPACRP
jgi:hypothetical protein